MAAAGSALLLSLAIAAVVAFCNATSSARLTALYPQFGSPYRAELAVGAFVAVVAAVADVRAAIGFSAFAVLMYYAIANASAITLGRRMIPAVGLLGCLTLAILLPFSAVIVGAGVVLLGALVYALRLLR